MLVVVVVLSPFSMLAVVVVDSPLSMLVVVVVVVVDSPCLLLLLLILCSPCVLLLLLLILSVFPHRSEEFRQSLEHMRERVYQRAVVKIQSVVRMFLARTHWPQLKFSLSQAKLQGVAQKTLE